MGCVARGVLVEQKVEEKRERERESGGAVEEGKRRSREWREDEGRWGEEGRIRTGKESQARVMAA